MKTASLLRSVRRLQNGSIFFTNQWHGKSTLPIVISERELLHEKCIVIPEEWRLKFVYTEYSPFMIDRFYYGVRTDEYPLMWVWYWWKLRFDKSLEFLIMGLVLSLEVWGLARITPGAKPSLGDLKLPCVLKK